MATHSKHTSRMDFHIYESRGIILIKQKWKYFWLNAPDTSGWSYSQKQGFHQKVDTLIWKSWGKHFFLNVGGKSSFAKKYASKRWNVNFDIEWVLNKEHWKVYVTKIAKGGWKGSKVEWKDHEIYLDTEDSVMLSRTDKKNGKTYKQYPAVHEFGHTIGNSWVFKRGDEYKSSSSHLVDTDSVMNIGNKIRDRHLWYILKELNTMIPDTKFSQ